ncbi:MAG: hypothetical protein RLZZ341_1765 [Pseudomonadota bacterium]|jgi:hypothetical protein
MNWRSIEPRGKRGRAVPGVPKSVQDWVQPFRLGA